MLVLFSILNTKNIQTSSEVPTIISFNELIKEADIDFLKKIGPPSIIKQCSSQTYNLFHLNQEYQYRYDKPVEKPLEKPVHPFMLIPLFKIRDLDNKEVNHRFFQRCNFNVIYNLNKQIIIGYLNKFLEPYKPVNLKIGDRIITNLRDHVHNKVNGHFIFKDPSSDCAMLYYGVMLDSYNFNNPLSALTKLYHYYILRRDYNEADIIYSNMIYPEGITIEFEINISQLLTEISGQINTEDNHSRLFYLKTNKQLESNIIKVCLKGEIVWGQLYLKIFKYSNSQEINDMYLEMFLLDNRAQDFYDAFKQRLISEEHHWEQ